jgi:nucleoside phosphorylase
MPASAPRPEDLQFDIAVVCALDLEAAAMAKLLRQRQRLTAHRFVVEFGRVGDLRLGVVRGGPTPGRIAAAADALIDVHRPRLVLCAGFAVALEPELRAGDVAVPTELADSSGTGLPVPAELLGVLRAAATAPANRLVSVPRWPRRRRDKEQLARRSAAQLADTSSFALQQACQARETACGTIRVIVDPADRDAVPETLAVFAEEPGFRAGAAVGAFLHGAGRLGTIWKLRDQARRHAKRLAETVEALVPRLPHILRGAPG